MLAIAELDKDGKICDIYDHLFWPREDLDKVMIEIEELRKVWYDIKWSIVEINLVAF